MFSIFLLFQTTLARHFHIGPDYNQRNTHIYSALSKYNGNGSIRLTTSMPNNTNSRVQQSIEPNQKIESNLSILQTEPISDQIRLNNPVQTQRERCVSVTSQSTLITSLSKSDALASTTSYGDKVPVNNNKRNSTNNNHHHQSTLSTIAEKLRRGTRKVLLFRTSPNNSTPQSPVSKEAKLKKGNSVDSAHTNTISNSSLQEVDAEEFDSAELTKFMGEINNEIR